MQSAPAGWPTDDTETTPTASVTSEVSGSEETVEPVSWQVTREIATDLPDQVQSIAGVSVAGATIDIPGQAPEVQRSEFVPFEGRATVRHVSNTALSLTAGFAGVEVPLFTGRIIEGSGDYQSNALQVTGDDLASLLRHPATLPPLSRQQPPSLPEHPEAGDPIYPGISATWVLDTVLRQAEFNATPAMVDGTAVSVPCQGSLWPEKGTLAFSEHDVDDPTFEPVVWVVGGTRLLAWADADGRIAVAPDGVLPIDNLAISGWCSDVGGTDPRLIVTPKTDDGSQTEIIVRSDSITVTMTSPTGASTPEALTVTVDGPWQLIVDRTGSTTADITATTPAGSDSATVTVPSDWAGRANGGVVMRNVDSIRTAGIRLSDTTADDGVLDHTPTADLDPSLNTITATPGLQADQTQWEVLQEVAAAELGAVWLSETGTATFRNRDSLRGVGVTPIEVTTRDSIVGLQWWESAEQVRQEIRVPVRPVAATTSAIPNLVVWSLDHLVMVGAHARRAAIIDAELTAVAIGLDTSVVNATAVASSRYQGNSEPDGSGASSALQIDIEQVGPRLARIRVRSAFTHTTPRYVVDSSGDPYLFLTSLMTIRQPDSAEAYAVALTDADDTYGYSVLTMPDSAWMMDDQAAQAVADFLADQLGEAQPVVRTLEVVPNLLLQLGDIVDLVDPGTSGFRVRCVITGIVLAGSAGTVAQRLTVRPLPYLFADFNDEWSGETFGDFNTEMAGVTFAEYNEDPWRFDA